MLAPVCVFGEKAKGAGTKGAAKGAEKAPLCCCVEPTTEGDGVVGNAGVGSGAEEGLLFTHFSWFGFQSIGR